MKTEAEQKRFIDLVEAATGSKFRPANKLTILQNGDQIFPAMLAAIRSAKHSIEFTTYVYWSSDIASEFADALSERARAGVKVRLLVDAVGGAVMNARTVWQLERAGVRVAWFRPLRWSYMRKLNNRTHRKVLVVDAKRGFCGGVGIADEWVGNADTPDHFRETHTQITGPAVADLFASFAENWHEATGEHLKPMAQPADAGLVTVHTASSTAGTPPTVMERLFQAVIAASRHRLWITTAYFVPSDRLSDALCEAAQRGVDVRLLTNGPLTNHRITRWAGRASYQKLLAAGVKIYEYQGTVLHSKVLTIDGSWGTIGSANLDDRSLVLNDELNISFTDPDLIETLDHQFEADIERAREIRPGEWPGRPLPGRLAEAGAALFRRQL